MTANFTKNQRPKVCIGEDSNFIPKPYLTHISETRSPFKYIASDNPVSQSIRKGANI